jgi:hypothetical protein
LYFTVYIDVQEFLPTFPRTNTSSRMKIFYIYCDIFINGIAPGWRGFAEAPSAPSHAFKRVTGRASQCMRRKDGAARAMST